MEVVVCYKIVPEEQDIIVQKDQTISIDRAEFKIGQYDLNAIEAGVQVVEEVGGKVTALTIGDNVVENSKLKKGILSRGADELLFVSDETLKDADSFQTAYTLASVIRKQDYFDLVLCGEGSSDLYSQQVGIQLGEILGVPTINGVSNIKPFGDKIIVERTLEDEIEMLEVTLPAVLSVTSDINTTRVPNMKDILRAGKKPSNNIPLKELEIENTSKVSESIKTLAPDTVERKHEIVDGENLEQVQNLFNKIRKEL